MQRQVSTSWRRQPAVSGLLARRRLRHRLAWSAGSSNAGLTAQGGELCRWAAAAQAAKRAARRTDLLHVLRAIDVRRRGLRRCHFP